MRVDWLRAGTGITLMLFASVCLADVPPPPSGNILYGTISSNRTLTFASPGPVYDVIGDLTVAPGVTLAIDSGVTLRFTANSDFLASGQYQSLAELIVYGHLAATAGASPIQFISSTGLPDTWGQIFVGQGGSANLTNVSIEGAHHAMSCQGSASMDNCSSLLGSNDTTLIARGDLTVSNSRFDLKNVAASVDGGSMTMSSTFLRGSSYGLRVGSGSAYLQGCEIVTNTLGAICVEEFSGNVTLTNCQISGPNQPSIACVGVSADGGTVSVIGSSIVGVSAGIETAEGVTGTILGNLIRGIPPPHAGSVGLSFWDGVSTVPADTVSIQPNIVKQFTYGAWPKGTSPIVSNALVDSVTVGILSNATSPLVRYCTVTHSEVGIEMDRGTILNSITVAGNNGGMYIGGTPAQLDYCDSWSNGTNFGVPPGAFGTHNSVFDPAFVNPISDYHLSESSLFLHFASGGGQIGAYGPGPVTVGVERPKLTWARIKANYR